MSSGTPPPPHHPINTSFQKYNSVLPFVQMKKRAYKPVDATYVGLFNAFAESPPAFHEDALQRAHRLREEMHLKGHTPNQIVYHSMIKGAHNFSYLIRSFFYEKKIAQCLQIFGSFFVSLAFGRRGDMITAFQLADEMATNRICIDDATFSFLLMACISDKESGLMHAIKVGDFSNSIRFQVNLHCLVGFSIIRLID